MGNKTIYVKDDELWTKAKKASGKEGVSRLIEKALQDFVAGKELDSAGFERISIEMNEYGGSDWIAFDGRRIDERDVFRDGWGWEYTVYLTKGHQLVLVAKPDEGEVSTFPDEYHVCQTLAGMANLDAIALLQPDERKETMAAVAGQLGPDWRTWID